MSFNDVETDRLSFQPPFEQQPMRDDLRGYLESYGVRYATDIDDERASRIAAQLPQWWTELFEAVFSDRTAQRLFNAFQDQEEEHLLTISASHQKILALPWALLRDSAGTYLLHEDPSIPIRRRLAGAGGGRKPFQVITKDTLWLLFVIAEVEISKEEVEAERLDGT